MLHFHRRHRALLRRGQPAKDLVYLGERALLLRGKRVDPLGERGDPRVQRSLEREHSVASSGREVLDGRRLPLVFLLKEALDILAEEVQRCVTGGSGQVL